MVQISKVYTKGGDEGQTSLIGGKRVPKSHARIACYGTVDELNAIIGLVSESLKAADSGDELQPILRRIQNELFNLGCDLATEPGLEKSLPVIEKRHVDALEAEIDKHNEKLEPLTSFVLPGGGMPSAYFHLARTVCRRAERLMVGLAESGDNEVSELAIAYINRLSDAFFVLGRYASKLMGSPEALWDSRTT